MEEWSYFVGAIHVKYPLGKHWAAVPGVEKKGKLVMRSVVWLITSWKPVGIETDA